MEARLRRIWIQITADKRRFGVLVACVLVGLLLWARIIVITKPPQRAVAGDQKVQARASGKSEPVKPGSSDMFRLEPISIELAGVLGRDPFRISPQHFPKPTPAPTETKEVVELPLNLAEEQERARALRTAQLRDLASGLSLGAVMGGGVAVINGRTVTLGGEIKAGRTREVTFTLVDIGERSVVVEAEGRRFELRMSLGVINKD